MQTLAQRKTLSSAGLIAGSLRHVAPTCPAVFVLPAPKPPAVPRQETTQQAEMRRARVDALTRVPPAVVITNRWTYVSLHFDAVEAVPLRLPLWQRLRLWLRRAE